MLYQPSSEREKIELADRIRKELRRLRILGHLKGYYYLTYILLEIVPNPGQLTLVTKSLYPDTGRSFGVSPSSVERAIRTAISVSWQQGGGEVLDQMADHHLAKRPTASQFIGIVSDYIRRTS